MDFPRAPVDDGVGRMEPGKSKDEVLISKVKEIEPAVLLFFSNSKGELGVKAYHPFLVWGSVSIVGEYRGGKAFFGPVVSGHKVVINEISCCSRV